MRPLPLLLGLLLPPLPIKPSEEIQPRWRICVKRVLVNRPSRCRHMNRGRSGLRCRPDQPKRALAPLPLLLGLLLSPFPRKSSKQIQLQRRSHVKRVRISGSSNRCRNRDQSSVGTGLQGIAAAAMAAAAISASSSPSDHSSSSSSSESLPSCGCGCGGGAGLAPAATRCAVAFV